MAGYRGWHPTCFFFGTETEGWICGREGGFLRWKSGKRFVGYNTPEVFLGWGHKLWRFLVQIFFLSFHG